jgi:hypothetical protein
MWCSLVTAPFLYRQFVYPSVIPILHRDLVEVARAPRKELVETLPPRETSKTGVCPRLYGVTSRTPERTSTP